MSPSSHPPLQPDRHSMASLLSKNPSNRDENSPLLRNEQDKIYNLHKLKTSILLSDNRDFKVIISMPRIEYRIDCENFTFIKTLSPSNIQDYQKSLFQGWHLTAIQQLMSYEKFQK